MIKRLLWGVILIVLCAVPVMGQDSSYSPENAYREALRRIEEARVSGAVALDLSNIYPLHSIPPEIGQLTHLKQLTITYSPIEGLPSEIGQLINLQHLDLSNSPITSLPPDIGQLVNLQFLDLNGSSLIHLPPEIGQLQHLKKLTLNWSKVTSLPPEIGLLSELEWLELKETAVTSIPPEIGQLQALERLDVSGWGITRLPVEISHLPHLQTFLFYMPAVTFPPQEITKYGMDSTLTYLRDYEAMLMRQTIAAIAAGIGGIALLILAFRWRQRRGLSEKKKRA